MLSVLRNIFRPKSRTFLYEDKYVVEKAFECGGRTYYQFANQMEAPAGRQLAALGMYDELEMRCDKKFLEDYCRAAEKIMSQPKINIRDLALLTAHLKERLNLVPLPEFVYKLASVVFFDKDEPVSEFNWEYNEEKIKFWKAHGGTLDFFMTTPLRDLMQPLSIRPEDIKIYSGVVRKIDAIHRELHTDILSKEQ